MTKAVTDPAILRMRELFQASGKTLEEVGVRMGFASAVARKSVWQLLNKVDDPKVSTLRKFADAIGADMSELFLQRKKRK